MGGTLGCRCNPTGKLVVNRKWGDVPVKCQFPWEARAIAGPTCAFVYEIVW